MLTFIEFVRFSDDSVIYFTTSIVFTLFTIMMRCVIEHDKIWDRIEPRHLYKPIRVKTEFSLSEVDSKIE